MLVVEDNPDTQQALAELLRLDGYEVVCAGNGKEALEQLAGSEPPCLILLDYAMPVMDGRAFRAAQRQDERLASIPVILLTAHLATAFAARSIDAAEVVEKPVQYEQQLRPLLKRYCP